MPILVYMRTRPGKYEAEIRLALVLIVGLLLVLNISTTYMLYRVKTQLTVDLDQKLAWSLTMAARQQSEGPARALGRDQREYIRHETGVTDIEMIPIRSSSSETTAESIAKKFATRPGYPDMDAESMSQLLDGRQLYRFGQSNESRFGLLLTKVSTDEQMLFVAKTDAWIVGKIGSTARTALYLAVGIVILIAILMVTLPRYILRPFRKLRETAISAGRLTASGASDDVAEIIQSYENIIEELKRSETELARLYRESSNRAERLERINDYILKSIGSGVVNIDLAGKIIGFNRAASDILGRSDEDVLDRHYLAAFPNEMEINLMITAGLERGDTAGPREIEIDDGTGRRRWLGIESSLIYDDRDQVVGVTLLIADMTEMKKLQTELEANRQLAALGEMTGGLAHQLRNSLAAISGFCQLLQKKTMHDPALDDIAGSVRAEATSSASMVNRFLTFARPLSLMEEMLDLTSLLEDCREKSLVKADKKSVQVVGEFASGPAKIEGDALLLKEALGNVMDNAIQAVEVGGHVQLRLDIAGDHAEIRIIDDGPGIPESLRENIFTPFVSSKPSGTGLGLALARKIINLHGGSISFDPDSESGAVCRISLPLSASAESPQLVTVEDGKNQ